MNARSADLIAPTFEVAERSILAPSGLDERRLSQVLDTLMSRGVDYADLYFELSREESWALEDGIVKEGSHSIEQGVGAVAISGEETELSARGRHDPCVLPRAVPMVEAMAALVLVDHALRQRAVKID